MCCEQDGETMNIFDYALQLEKDGETLYHDLAADAPGSGLDAVFTRLADAEARHYRVVSDMKNAVPDPELVETEVIETAANIFTRLQAEKDPDRFADPEATDRCVEAYRRAADIEKKSMEFYRSKAGETGDTVQRALFERLAEEEKRHYWVVLNILKYVSRPDFNWIEFAEWNHMEAY